MSKGHYPHSCNFPRKLIKVFKNQEFELKHLFSKTYLFAKKENQMIF